MWLKCNHCREIVYRKEVDRNNKVCPKCEYHFPISVSERIALLTDLGTFKEWDANVEPSDPLEFTDSRSYRDRLKSRAAASGKGKYLGGQLDQPAEDVNELIFGAENHGRPQYRPVEAAGLD